MKIPIGNVAQDTSVYYSVCAIVAALKKWEKFPSWTGNKLSHL